MIMIFNPKKEKQGRELIEEAEKLGVATDGIFKPNAYVSYLESPFREAALQERVRSAKNTRYAKLTWIIALMSAIASVVSAIAAWFAVLR